MMAHMSPEMELVYIAARALNLRCFQLGTLLIKDVDAHSRTAAIDGKQYQLNDRVWKMINVAIGTRSKGHVFLSPTGKQWTPMIVRKTLPRVKKASGIDEGGKRVLI